MDCRGVLAVLVPMKAPKPPSTPAPSLNEQHYQAVVDAALDSFVTVDGNGVVVEFNRAAERAFGYSREEAIGQEMVNLIVPDHWREAHNRGFARFKADPNATAESHLLGKGIELEACRKDGSVFPIEIAISHIPGVDKELFVAAIRDVSERSALRESERSLRALFDHSLDAMLIVDDDRRCIDANPAACELLGQPAEQVIGQDIFSLFVEYNDSTFDADKVWEDFQAHGVMQGQRTVRRPDGELRTIDRSAVANFIPGKHLSVMRDVTERQKLEEQLRQSQKMEAVGQLTGGVAHEFNNLLTAIAGYADFALDRAREDEILASDLQEILDAANRARGLTGQLLAFSRRQMMRFRSLNLNDSVTGTSKLLKQLIGEHIEVRTLLADDLGSVLADPGQLEQVLVNLAVNARDAMPLGGVLTIETENLVLDHFLSEALQPGPYVCLAVSDNGSGMDEKTRTRMFEPFFTTKEVGQGTGLGLSTVYGIIAQSNGHISAYSEAGVGTTFRIYLPRTDIPATVPEEETMSNTPGGAETILLVEDEDVVRRLVNKMLVSLGYKVVDAADPEIALAIVSSEEHVFDLLVTDVVMPKMNGKELADRLVAAHPSLKVLFTSGYTSNAIKTNGQLDPDMVMLQKPFTMTDLSQKVRQVLGAPTA
jgi:two-component system cell cycle sensor histidine kinase/response regulator CckA